MQSATRLEHATGTAWSLPFPPLHAAIVEANRRRGLTARTNLTTAQYRTYNRALNSGRISLNGADILCDRYGWHPREIWTDGTWDWLADIVAKVNA